MITVTLRIGGRSVVLPIPKKFLSLASLEVGHEVSMNVQGGRLMIEAAKRKFTILFEEMGPVF